MEFLSQNKPYFSIVIPAYNRESEIVRAVNSCLVQSFADFEVVVVDDGSTDGTAAAVEGIQDPRIVLIRHEQNKGVCSARNTGIEYSRGEWVIYLDSDDELVPGILAEIRKKTGVCLDDIGSLGFLCLRDTGEISPDPMPPEQILDYDTLISWSDTLVESDFVQCVRRSTFPSVKFAAGRAYEDSYLYDFSLLYKIHIFPQVAVLVHTDSHNRITTSWGRAYTDKLLSGAKDQLATLEYILSRHGEALKRRGPRYFRIFSKSRVLYSFLAGRRLTGSRLAIKYLASYPRCLEGWVIFFAGLMGPQVLAALKQHKYHRSVKKR
jgi:glycosyltransferase involved in cell wall biosynthesis